MIWCVRKMKFLPPMLSKITARTRHTQTDATERITTPHSRLVKGLNNSVHTAKSVCSWRTLAWCYARQLKLHRTHCPLPTVQCPVSSRSALQMKSIRFSRCGHLPSCTIYDRDVVYASGRAVGYLFRFDSLFLSFSLSVYMYRPSLYLHTLQRTPANVFDGGITLMRMKWILYRYAYISHLIHSLPNNRSLAKSVRYFLRSLFLCLFVCQHDNFRSSKHRMIKLGGRCTVQKS